MSTEKMRKLMMLAENLDENDRQMENLATTSSGDEYCPTCDGWGEYMPKGSSMGIDFDDIVPCPDCGPESGYKPRLKSQVIKDLAHEIDADWVDYDLVDVEPEDLKGFPKINEAFTRKHFQMVADTLQKIEDPEVRRAQAEEYAQQFAAANPRFRRDLFMKAAGVLEENDVVQTPGAKHLASLKNKKTPDPEDMGDTEVGYDDGYGDADTDHYGYDESVGELDEVQTLPREIKNRKPIKPDWSDVEYETCPECGVEGGHENGCAVLGALYNEDLNEEQSEFRLKDIVGADNFAELVSDLNTGGIDYSAAYFTPLYWHFLDEYPDEIPVGSRTGRPEDPEEYVLDNLERYHSEEIKSYMNTPDMDESNCGVCGETFKWEGSPDEEMCPRCTQEYLGEANCPCGKEGCECGPDCDCEPVEEDRKKRERPEVKGINDKYDDELKCKHCGDYFCTSKFGGECPAIQRDLFDEISLESIAESLLDERSQPKDYEMSDEELAAEIEDETSEFERDHIDKEIEDEELGLRFD